MVSPHGERVGEAVADIQPRPVAASAEATKRVDGNLGLLRRDADDVKAAIAEQKFDIRLPGLALAALDDEGQLDSRDRREQPNWRVAERACKTLRVGFPQQNGDERRGIDYHSA